MLSYSTWMKSNQLFFLIIISQDFSHHFIKSEQRDYAWLGNYLIGFFKNITSKEFCIKKWLSQWIFVSQINLFYTVIQHHLSSLIVYVFSPIKRLWFSSNKRAHTTVDFRNTRLSYGIKTTWTSGSTGYCMLIFINILQKWFIYYLVL